MAITETTTRLAFAAYRPRPGKTDELLRLFGEELATLRRRGHVTQRSAPVVRTDDGGLLVVVEWSSPHAVDDAHSDPEVVALWEQKGQLADYLPLRALAGSQVPFASWPVVAEV
jgi:hypothetical protein